MDAPDPGACAARRQLGSADQLGGQTGSAHVDPVAAHRDALTAQESSLAPALGQAPVGAHHPVPGHVRGFAPGQHTTHQAGCAGLYVPVGLDESLGYGPDPAEDALAPVLTHSLA